MQEFPYNYDIEHVDFMKLIYSCVKHMKSANFCIDSEEVLTEKH